MSVQMQTKPKPRNHSHVTVPSLYEINRQYSTNYTPALRPKNILNLLNVGTQNNRQLQS